MTERKSLYQQAARKLRLRRRAHRGRAARPTVARTRTTKIEVKVALPRRSAARRGRLRIPRVGRARRASTPRTRARRAPRRLLDLPRLG
jgi:hypothetical protein